MAFSRLIPTLVALAIGAEPSVSLELRPVNGTTRVVQGTPEVLSYEVCSSTTPKITVRAQGAN
jgi:hypothetical protein